MVNVVDGLREFADGFREAVSPLAVALAAGAAVAVVVEGTAVVRLFSGALLGFFTYHAVRDVLGDDERPSVDDRRDVEGEVTQVLGVDDLAEYAVGGDLARRVEKRREFIAVVEQDGPDSRVVRTVANVPVLGHLLGFVVPGGLYDTEVVLFEDAPAEGETVSVSARPATVEKQLDAVEPATSETEGSA